MLVIDSHCDTPSQLMRGLNLCENGSRSQVDFPKLSAGGVGASFFALYTPGKMKGDEATAYCLKMIARTRDALDKAGTSGIRPKLAYSSEDIIANYKERRFSVLLGMENGSPVQNSLSLLRQFYRMGVRYMTLTHNSDNLIGDSAAEGHSWHGLSPFGREVIREMNRLGMLVDVAHCSDETFRDCLKYSKAPIVSTHSCCRALASHRRNMTDDMIRAMADKGGVIQINFYPVFLSDSFAATLSDWESAHPEAEAVESDFIADPSDTDKRLAWDLLLDSMAELARPGVGAIADHIDHAVNVGGIDHVGIGSDFDGIAVCPSGMDNVSSMPLVFEELRRRGYSEDSVEKIAGGNFLRVFSEVECLAGPPIGTI